MPTASNQSSFYLGSQMQACGWRAFCIEFICGSLAVLWYLLYLAEGITLRRLSQLEKLAAPPADSLPGYGGARNIPFCDEQASFGRLAERTPHSQR